MEAKRAVPIQRLHVESFGCVRDATIELEPLTVLVGPNDSGKSMILRAMQAIAEACRGKDGWAAVFPNASALVAQTFNGEGTSIRLEVEGDVGGPYSYDVEIEAEPNSVHSRREQLALASMEARRTEQGTAFRRAGEDSYEGPFGWSDRHLPLLHESWFAPNPRNVEEFKRFQALLRTGSDVARSIRGTRMYSLRPERLRQPNPVAAQRGEPRVRTTGDGLPYSIAELLLGARDVLARIEKALALAMPHVKRIDVKQQTLALAQGEILVYDLELVTQSGARIPSRAISDGVLLFLGYLYLVLGPEPASVLLIEEPETGIHPGLLRKLMKLFRDMTTGAHGGPPTQIILTTHSPMLLNLVEPQEIRVVQRGEDGATTVTPFMSAPDIEQLLDYQGPGEIWVNEGEEYLVRRKARS